MRSGNKSIACRTQAESPAIELHIEVFVLSGVSASDRHAVADAVKRELGRLLAKQGIPKAWRTNTDNDRLEGGVFSVTKSRKPRTIGTQVARAIYNSQATHSRPRC